MCGVETLIKSAHAELVLRDMRLTLISCSASVSRQPPPQAPNYQVARSRCQVIVVLIHTEARWPQPRGS